MLVMQEYPEHFRLITWSMSNLTSLPLWKWQWTNTELHEGKKLFPILPTYHQQVTIVHKKRAKARVLQKTSLPDLKKVTTTDEWHKWDTISSISSRAAHKTHLIPLKIHCTARDDTLILLGFCFLLTFFSTKRNFHGKCVWHTTWYMPR